VAARGGLGPRRAARGRRVSPLRFCMVTTFYPPHSFGGDAVTVQRLARALVRRGHHVTVIHDQDAFAAMGGSPEGPASPADEGVHVVGLRSRWGGVASLLTHQLGRPVVHAARLRRLLGGGDWDVVNFHNVSLVGGPGVLRYPRDAVTVYMAHEHWLVCPTHILWRHRRELCDRRECLRCVIRHRRPPQLWRYTGLLPRALAAMDAVVALSDFSRRKHAEFGLRREMEVVPCFLPAAGPSAAGRPPGAERPYFLFAGRLEQAKGLQDLLPAFQAWRDADLLVAGAGADAEALRCAAADLPHVRFLGRLAPEALPAFYRHAVALLVPSLCYETFGAVIIEAFREGTPVVARRLGPFPELVTPGRTGDLFDGPADLGPLLHRLLRDPVYRDRLGEGARQAFVNHWSEAVVLPAYLEVVRRAALRKGHRRVVEALGGPEPGPPATSAPAGEG
jgi:glycosyltransferase involved in cell wall biosynthesis